MASASVRVRAAAIAWLGFAAGAQSAEPASGTLTETSGPLSYTAGPFYVPNPTSDLGTAGLDPVCDPELQNCDIYSLTVTLADDYADSHPDDTITIRVSWEQILASPNDEPDFDVYVYDDQGSLVSDAGVTSSNPEVIVLPVFNGTRKYEIRTVTYTPDGKGIEGSITLDRFDEEQSKLQALFGGALSGSGLLSLALLGLARTRRRHL